jgi:hypothetical protein
MGWSPVVPIWSSHYRACMPIMLTNANIDGTLTLIHHGFVYVLRSRNRGCRLEESG